MIIFKDDAKVIANLSLYSTQKGISCEVDLFLHFCVVEVFESKTLEVEDNALCRNCLTLFCLNIRESFQTRGI